MMSTGDIPLDNRPAPPTKAELGELAMMIMAYEDTGLLPSQNLPFSPTHP